MAQTFTAILIDDSITACDCCGRKNLKATVLMQSETGELVHFGRTCAARNSGKIAQQITAEVRAARDLAHGMATNQLLRMRRAGAKITREVVREVAAEHPAADLKILLQHW